VRPGIERQPSKKKKGGANSQVRNRKKIKDLLVPGKDASPAIGRRYEMPVEELDQNGEKTSFLGKRKGKAATSQCCGKQNGYRGERGG